MNNTLQKTLYLGWGLLMAWGLYGVAMRFTHGHEMAAYGSYVSWGLWVAAKVFFVGIGIGCSLFAFAACAFNSQKNAYLIRPALLAAFAAISAGLVIIAFDLGHMGRLVEVFYRPHFSSLLALATWGTPIYLAFILYAIVALGKKQISIVSLGVIGLVFGTALSLFINGGEFSTLISSPNWHSIAGPMQHFTQTLAAGVALVALFAINTSKKEPYTNVNVIFLGVLLLNLLLEFSSLMIDVWNSSSAGTPTEWAYLILGLTLPICLLFMTTANRTVTNIASLLVITLNFWTRFDHVLSGQTTEHLPGLATAFADQRLTYAYTPSSFEYAVVAFSIALAIAVYFIGHRVFLAKSTESNCC
nr:NrfD/PsrC family molybdoenzyme membrane anchor subunit [Pseudodesulfovibrio sp.]